MSTITLTDEDKRFLNLVASTEVDHRLRLRNPEEYSRQIAGVIDTILNRVASPQYPDSVRGVVEQHRQFSKITGPASLSPYGSVDRVPEGIGDSVFDQIVADHISAREAGEASSVGGNLNYANPNAITANNRDWVAALSGPTYGDGPYIHRHGTTSGYTPVEAVLGPSTALSAIEATAPTVSAQNVSAYAPPRPSTTPPQPMMPPDARQMLAPPPQPLRPFNPSERFDNGDGTYSTERSITWQLPDGRWITTPTLFQGPNGVVDLSDPSKETEARSVASSLLESGYPFPTFATETGAVSYAQDRSSRGGAGAPPIPPTTAYVPDGPSPGGPLSLPKEPIDLPTPPSWAGSGQPYDINVESPQGNTLYQDYPQNYYDGGRANLPPPTPMMRPGTPAPPSVVDQSFAALGMPSLPMPENPDYASIYRQTRGPQQPTLMAAAQPSSGQSVMRPTSSPAPVMATGNMSGPNAADIISAFNSGAPGAKQAARAILMRAAQTGQQIPGLPEVRPQRYFENNTWKTGYNAAR